MKLLDFIYVVIYLFFFGNFLVYIYYRNVMYNWLILYFFFFILDCLVYFSWCEMILLLDIIVDYG